MKKLIIDLVVPVLIAITARMIGKYFNSPEYGIFALILLLFSGWMIIRKKLYNF